jgi:hypothetical protein
VLFAFIGVTLAMATMWHSVRGGMLLRRCVDCASHSSSSSLDLGAAQDILLY